MKIRIKDVNYEENFSIIEDLNSKKFFKVLLKNDVSNFYTFKYKSKRYYFFKYFVPFIYKESKIFELDPNIQIKNISSFMNYLSDLKDNYSYYKNFNKLTFDKSVKLKIKIEKGYMKYNETWMTPSYFSVIFLMDKGISDLLTQTFWNRLFSILYYGSKKLTIYRKTPRASILTDGDLIGCGLIQ